MPPDDWRSVRLGDVIATTVGGGTPSRSNGDYWNGTIPWATVKDFGPRVLLDTKEHITFEGLNNSSSNLVPEDTVVMATRMNVGALFRSGTPMAINQDLRGLFPTPSLSKEYLFYFLQSSGTALSRLATGTTVKGLRIDTLKFLPLALPPLPEQRKIAAILSSVDNAIEKTQAVIDQVQVVKRGLMQELLTKGLPRRHERFKKTDIGEIPEEWDLLPAATICKRIVVGIVVRPARHYAASGVPCLRSLNVREDKIVEDEMKYITHDSNHELRKSRLKPGDVVTVRTGYPGTSAVVPQRLGGANCVDLIITTPGPRIRGAFLSRFINSDRGRAAVAKRKSGLAQQHFNVGAMKAMLTPVPSLGEQDDICDVLRSPDRRLQTETAYHSALVSLKSALMSVLLTGELRVTPNPEPA